MLTKDISSFRLFSQVEVEQIAQLGSEQVALTYRLYQDRRSWTNLLERYRYSALAAKVYVTSGLVNLLVTG